MDFYSLKHRLIMTGYFINNEYLDKYVNLILQNLTTKYVKTITQRHHILQRKYYRLEQLSVDNSLSNMVNLTYADHCLAHYYLYNCTQNKLKAANANAVRNLFNLKLTDLTILTPELLDVLQNSYTKIILGLMTHHIDKDKLYNYYIIENHTRQETAKYFNCTRQNIDKWLNYYEIYKNKTATNRPRANKISKQEFKKIYIIENKSIAETANYFNISTGKVKNLIREFNLKKSKTLADKKRDASLIKRRKFKLTKEELYNLYIIKNCSINFLAKKVEVSKACIKKYLRLYSIKKTDKKLIAAAIRKSKLEEDN